MNKLKKPYYSEEDRRLVNTDTYTGASMRLHLAWMKLKRAVYYSIFRKG